MLVLLGGWDMITVEENHEFGDSGKLRSPLTSTMSLLRLIVAARLRASPTTFVQRRNVSTASHAHEHEKEHDNTVYPSEGLLVQWITILECIKRTRAGFNGGIWRKTILLSLLVVAFYKYAPAPGEDAYLTRWIAMYTPSSERWLNINVRHTAQQQRVADVTMLVNDAKKSRAYRYRYPQ